MRTEEAFRLEDVARGVLPEELSDTVISYWKDGEGSWWIYLPRGGIGQLRNHQVEEHDDGTITVTPSIGMRKASGAFVRHGFLRRGQWEEV